MSALAWLFGLGAAAVVFPILFHLIRKTPQGQTEFSSLMFLKPSPPTLTRRSRLDNLFLLLLRALAICLLAIAFMRPFFRGSSQTAEFDVQFRRVAILVDTSASMRRADVWERARIEVNSILSKLEPNDQVGLFAFDQELRTEVPFPSEESALIPGNNQIVIESIRTQMEAMKPTWAHSNLGQAMVALADQLDDWQDTTRSDDVGRRPKLQMVVVSDMQSGSTTDALQAYQWPAMVKTEFKSVNPTISQNATVSLLSTTKTTKQEQLRVRVSNRSVTDSEAFRVRWENRGLERSQSTAEDKLNQLTFIVGPGESRVMELPLEKALSANAFQLSGDKERFDNVYFTTPSSPQTMSLVYIGDDDPDDPETNLFYLARAFSRQATRSYQVYQFAQAIPETQQELLAQAKRISVDGEREPPDDIDRVEGTPTLLVLGATPKPKDLDRLQSWANGGTRLMCLANEPEMVKQCSRLLGAELETEKVRARSGESYAIMGQLELSDPLLQPFRDPRFSDFTELRFWKHSRVSLDAAATCVARFDDRSPALWRFPVGEGEVVGFSSSWRPSDSQWFLDPKFVAFFLNLMEWNAELPPAMPAVKIGQRLDFAAADDARTMIKPNGSLQSIPAGETRFIDTNLPGIYRLTDSISSLESLNDDQRKKIESTSTMFAVNLDRRESETDLLEVDQLERLDVQVGEHQSAAAELAQLRLLRDRDLEDRQKIWKWLIIAAIGLLIFETYYAGRKAVTATAAPLAQ